MHSVFIGSNIIGNEDSPEYRYSWLIASAPFIAWYRESLFKDEYRVTLAIL